jgi:hypothetical protein
MDPGLRAPRLKTRQAVSWGTGCEPGGATCPDSVSSGCFDYPSVNLPTLTAAWTKVTVPFANATGGGTALAGVVQELEWLSLDASWDFYVDEIAFYKGSPPAGPVAP